MSRAPLLLVFFFAACNQNATGPTDAAVDAPVAMDLPLPCPRTCSGCKASEICYTPGGFQAFQAFCARTCTVTSDCLANERCTAVFNEPGQPSVCVSKTDPLACPGRNAPDPTFHCDFPYALCKSAMVLQRCYSNQENLICGTEFIFCPSGCKPGDPDGGVSAAQCN